VLKTSESRLQGLYKKVSESSFKIAAGTLLYYCAAVRLLKNRGCLCFVSQNSVVPVQEQIENSIAGAGRGGAESSSIASLVILRLSASIANRARTSHCCCAPDPSEAALRTPRPGRKPTPSIATLSSSRATVFLAAVDMSYDQSRGTYASFEIPFC
jgi:hypothetical protein